MKENKYDDDVFFDKYSKMLRSQKGLEAAGEWKTLQDMLPDFRGKTVLDLGCGYGWHCRYAAEHGAVRVVGIDLSEKMLQVARKMTKENTVVYQNTAIEDVDFPKESFDVVLSSLALHYVADFLKTAEKIYRILKPGGNFIFSCEHPVFTAEGSQEWYLGENKEILHFPVDHYFYEGKREANFLGEKVVKYHRTLTTYLRSLLKLGFQLVDVAEPQPPQEMLDLPGMQDEMRRPMMLIVSARRP